jgi:hypothetical protein
MTEIDQSKKPQHLIWSAATGTGLLLSILAVHPSLVTFYLLHGCVGLGVGLGDFLICGLWLINLKYLLENSMSSGTVG